MDVKFNRQKIVARVQKAVDAALYAGASSLETNIRESLKRQNSSISAGGIPSAPGEPPATGTGRLSGSIVAIKADDWTETKPHYRVGTNIKYAAIQEYGGRIAAKKGKFLAVPLGVDGRRAAREAKGVSLRNLKLTLLRVKGKLLLVRFAGKARAAMKPLFILLKSVILPARPYMRPAYAVAKGQIKIRVELAIKDALGGA
jgi:phage gpG-like protein